MATASGTGRAAPALPWWRDGRWWLRASATYAVAAVAGFVAERLSVPLPWMLGPFFVCGALSAFGAPLAFLPLSREFSQLAVGLAVGLRFTPATFAATLALLPAMLAATVFVMAYTFLAALILKPLARLDDTSAFFATAAGGVADMALVASERGGDATSVAIVHALRVSATVAVVPVLVVAFGTPGSEAPAAPLVGDWIVWLVVAFGLSVLAVRLLKPTILPNPWLLGPMFVGIALGASGALTLTMPPIFIVLAQVFLGTWLGCQFRREILTRLPRVALSGLAVSLFMIACAGAGAFAMAAVTTLPVTTAFLALAPAAVTEMVITAKLMNLDAEIVTAFHVMRIALVCSTILLVFQVYNRLKGVAHGPRV